MMSAVIAEFCAAAAERGLLVPNDLQADGQLHRCPTADGKPGNRDGAYLLHVDGIPAGGFQNWADGRGWQDWCSRKPDTLSDADRAAHYARVAEDTKRRATKLAQDRADARAEAQRILAESAPCESHEYLTKKNVQAHGLRMTTRDYDLICSDGHTMHVPAGVLVVPLCDSAGGLHSLEFIWPDGKKRFLPGGQKEGHFFLLGNPDAIKAILCFAEGFATGATIHEATGYPTFVAFDCGNLASVARTARKQYPDSTIIGCADDDYMIPGNPGLTHAMRATQIVDGRLAVPNFGENRPEGATDFNDLYQAQGTDAVKACIAAAASPVTPPSNQPDREVALTDTGNAERFTKMFSEKVRYVPEWAQFFVWDERRWVEDSGTVRGLEFTKNVARSFLLDAHACTDEYRRTAISKHALRSEQEPRRKAMLSLVKAESALWLSHEMFDRDRLLLNVLNGTIDLRTGKLKSHDRQDFITRVVPVAYDAAASCPRWEAFLREVLPDEDTIAFIKRAVGYSLTGDVSAHCLFFLFGLGANGKSVFLRVLMALPGEYAVQAPTSMLLAKRGETHPTEITTLHGRRVAVCQETPAGRGWAEEILKHVTGGDRITARRMREDFWEFDPTHKLWVSGNHKPAVRGMDEGIWRRLRLVPFQKVFPEGAQDRKLADKLLAELPGILAWAVQGCREWQRDGLGTSTMVKAATADYREESNRLGPFLVERCELRPGVVVTRAELYRSYTIWSQDQGEQRPMSEREFVDALRSQGVEECWPKNASGRKCRGWRGIKLAGGAANTYAPDSSAEHAAAPMREANQNPNNQASTSVDDEEDLV
jgi:P4 family phage/plasmid primase-like protien